MALLWEQHVASMNAGLPKSLRYQKTEYEPSPATHQQNGLGKTFELFGFNFFSWKMEIVILTMATS